MQKKFRKVIHNFIHKKKAPGNKRETRVLKPPGNKRENQAGSMCGRINGVRSAIASCGCDPTLSIHLQTIKVIFRIPYDPPGVSDWSTCIPDPVVINSNGLG
jgi:hypothetical protein